MYNKNTLLMHFRFEEFQVVLWNEIGRIMDEGFDTFYCGGARDIDLLCGEIAVGTVKSIELCEKCPKS